MNIKGKSIVAVIILFFLGIIFVSFPITYIYDKIEYLKKGPEQFVEMDWKALYPFEEDVKWNRKENPILNFYDKLYEKIKEKGSNLSNDHLFIKNSVLGFYGKIEKMLGVEIIKDASDTTVYAGNGYWSYLQKKRDTDASISAVREWKEWLQERGIEFIFIQAPSKVLEEKDIIANIVDNYRISDKNKLCHGLMQAGVDVLDLRDFMPEDYPAYMEKFFKTDHHWKPSTGLWAAGILADKLNHEYGFQIDTELLQSEQYKMEIYPELFLGSQGKKVTMGYCRSEDMELLLPKFEHTLTVSIPCRGIVEQEGDFSILLDERQLERGNVYKLSPYAAYTYGDQSFITIRNEQAQSTKRILFLKDSFADVVVPYFGLVCQQVDVLDLRHFTGSLKTYIKENSYDMVVFLINEAGNSSGSEIDFSEHNNLWDFR